MLMDAAVFWGHGSSFLEFQNSPGAGTTHIILPDCENIMADILAYRYLMVSVSLGARVFPERMVLWSLTNSGLIINYELRTFQTKHTV